MVTTKLGSSDKRPGTASASVPIPSCRLYLQELLWALFTWAAGFYALFTGATHLGLAVYLIVQGGWAGCNCCSEPGRAGGDWTACMGAAGSGACGCQA